MCIRDRFIDLGNEQEPLEEKYKTEQNLIEGCQSRVWLQADEVDGKIVFKALRKKEERKDRLHQNYLRRKANGKQKEYEDRIKTEKRRQMEAKKAALRAEDMAKGIYCLLYTSRCV